MRFDIDNSLLSCYTGSSHHAHHSRASLVLRWCRNSFLLFLFLTWLFLRRALATQLLVRLIVYLFYLLTNSAFGFEGNTGNQLSIYILNKLLLRRRLFFFHNRLNLLRRCFWFFAPFTFLKDRLILFFLYYWWYVVLLRSFKLFLLNLIFTWFWIEFLFILFWFFWKLLKFYLLLLLHLLLSFEVTLFSLPIIKLALSFLLHKYLSLSERALLLNQTLAQHIHLSFDLDLFLFLKILHTIFTDYYCFSTLLEIICKNVINECIPKEFTWNQWVISFFLLILKHFSINLAVFIWKATAWSK